MTSNSTQSRNGGAQVRASNEAALMGRIAAGDREEPLIELYDRYATSLYRFGLGLLSDRQQAEELVQETFLRLWRSASQFDPGQSSVRSFVFLLARRVAADAHRRRVVRPPVAGEADPDARAATGPLPEQEVERLLAGVEVREALEVLPVEQREVLELGYDHQLTQSEIASRLRLPLGTVKTRTYRALRAMRVELDRRGFDV